VIGVCGEHPHRSDVTAQALSRDPAGRESRIPAAELEAFIARALGAGGINVRPQIKVLQERDAAALVDGDNGMGHVVMRYATRVAMDKAARAGVGWVGIRRSNHAGPAAHGLSLVFGLLAGVLNGEACGRSTIDSNRDDVTATNTGHAIVALKIDAFAPPEAFKANVDALLRDIRASQRMEGVDRIRVPGDASHATFLNRRTEGIPMARSLRNTVMRLATELGIEFVR
jgi:LDH2 family malate/lactate/ureidoglycolate dehydrogenase